MKFSTVVVVPKLTMVQVDMNRYGLDEADLRDRYRRDGKDADSIFASHNRQIQSIGILRERFPRAIYQREAFNQGVANGADLVIAAGGDDHFKYVSHYLRDTPILGLNTDPERSRGELLENYVEASLEELDRGNFRIDDETRIGVDVNGSSFFPSTSICAVGRSNPFGNFRYRIECRGQHDEHKITSGLVVYAGNGVGDWTKGAGRYLEELETFVPTEKKIGWVVREPHDDYRLMFGTVREGEDLSMVCYKDDSVISADGITEHVTGIGSGTRVRFRIFPVALRHVRIDGHGK